METQKKDIMTINEFAEEIRVHPNTVRNMVRSGRLNAFRVGGGKTSSYRIARTEINRLSMIDLEVIVQEMADKKSRGK